MPYQTSPDKVEKYSGLLDTLAIKCIKTGEAHEIHVSPDRKDKIAWQIHQLLASAEQYPRNEYDEKLRRAVTVRQMTGDPKLIRIEPKASEELQEYADEAPKSIPGYQKAIEKYLLKKTEATVTWAVKEDAEAEEARFREGLKASYEDIQLVDTEEVGDRELRTYALFPRQTGAPSKEEYYKSERPDLTDPEARRAWAMEQAERLDQELDSLEGGDTP